MLGREVGRRLLSHAMGCRLPQNVFDAEIKNVPATDLSVELNLRDRIIDVLEILADTDDAVQSLGFAGYFNLFFDYFDRSEFIPLSIMSNDETAAAREVLAVMNEASEATPQDMTPTDFIATGWPAGIEPLARQALDTFLKRGRSVELS
jgi:hypothetical protein